MARSTKSALADSLIKLLSEKTLDKITISDITDDCGVNRQTFYYHFRDVYELIQWIYQNAAEEAIGKNKSYDTWQEAYTALLEMQQEKRAFVMNTFCSISRDKLEKSISDGLSKILRDEVDVLSRDKTMSDQQKTVLSRFVAFGFTGMTLDWLANGMQPEPKIFTEQISDVISGNLITSIERCSARAEQLGVDGAFAEPKTL